MKPTILVLADWYLPGYKAGGLVTALSNLADAIGDTFSIFVFTRDRDLTDETPYPDIRAMEWQDVRKARVLYTSDLSFRHLRRRISEVRPDVIYLNSFFSTLVIKVLFLRRFGLLPSCAIVLSPRGEFSPGALRIKGFKKSIYVHFAFRVGLYDNLIWQASSELERQQIAKVLGTGRRKQPRIHVAWDLPSRDWLEASRQPPKMPKAAGARFLFISRISPKKNLVFAVNAMRKLSGSVQFDIFGPIDDREYWKSCEEQIKVLPANVTVRYRGTVRRELVPEVASSYDFFLLPTLGENFGYVILEAMAAGCPVILSNQTPWQDATSSGAGWSLPLDDGELWRCILQQCVDMDSHTYAAMSARARQFVGVWASSNDHYDETIELFHLALAR
ncbi:MAG: glycosyltransferase [Candidatus Acidiferrum sp.]